MTRWVDGVLRSGDSRIPFTDYSDLYRPLRHGGINQLARHVMRQRPSLFNYATQSVAEQSELLCRQIDSAPADLERKNQLVTIERPLPVL